MKLILVILLVVMAGLMLRTDPYGLVMAQGKQKKNPVVDSLATNPAGQGEALQVAFYKGEAHNHPLFAIWAEDMEGRYIQTLYVAKSIATSVFNYGDRSQGSWTDGVVRRPAALPYWSHKRGVKASDGLYVPLPDNPVPDAYSGPTPKNDFILETRLDEPGPDSYYVLLEVNQPWDWNDYWTNNKFPDNEEYKTSSQPAVVYRALVDKRNGNGPFVMEVIGHSHYSGNDGSLTEDVSTLTTALEIAARIEVRIGD